MVKPCEMPRRWQLQAPQNTQKHYTKKW